MKLLFEEPGFEYMINSIMEFQKQEQSEFFKESLYYFYTQINKDKVNKLDDSKKKEYIMAELWKVYRTNQSLFKEKIQAYQQHWNDNEEIIIQAFEDIFDLDLKDHFNSMKAYISLNPICPRYLDSNTFDIFYLNSAQGALGMSLHEITHFVWFKKWNTHFQDNWEEYDSPHLKWVFSEMVVESILSDKRLHMLNPYSGECVYKYFYNMKINGKPILEIIDSLFHDNSITDFMEKGYELCRSNEEIIRISMF